MLVGFGAFNVVEGLINHHFLGIHHVNETVPQSQWLANAAFAALFFVATYPAWSIWVFGYNPSLNDLLSLRCLEPQ
jgi:uncharacterized membrane protein